MNRKKIKAPKTLFKQINVVIQKSGKVNLFLLYEYLIKESNN